jgi:hypothetical protein
LNYYNDQQLTVAGYRLKGWDVLQAVDQSLAQQAQDPEFKL